MSGAIRQSRPGASHAAESSHANSWLRDAVLSDHETAAVRAWAAEVDGDPYDADFSRYDRRLRERLNGLPRHFVDAVANFGTAANAAGVVRLRGVPIPDMLPATPTVPYSKIRARIGTEPVMLALAMLIGHAISIPQMRNGDRVHNIYPMPEDADTQKASNSVRLELHSEMAFQENAPDALAILCLRACADPPATGFCDLRSVWDDLGERERSLLQETAFALRSIGPDGLPRFFGTQPFATLEAAGPRFQYDWNAHGVTPEHEAALESLRHGMARSITELTLAPGDVVLIDNRHVVHGRSPMHPGYGGDDRWLQRCLLMLRAPSAGVN